MSVVRRAIQILAVVCILLVGIAAMAVVVTQTAWFKEWTRGFIVRQASNYLNGDVSIGRLDGNLFFGVELEDVNVTMDGKSVVSIKDVGLDYNAFGILQGHAVIDDIRVNQPVVYLEKTDEGWNLARLVKVRTPQRPERRRLPLEIGEIGISDGNVQVKDKSGRRAAGVEIPSRIDRLDASVSVKSDEDALTIEIAHVSLRAKDPNLGLNALSGRITQRDDGVTFENVAIRTEETSLRVDGSTRNAEHHRIIELNASSDKFDTDEIARLVPALRGYGLQPAFELSARGPADHLSVDVNLRDGKLGHVEGDLTVDTAGSDRRIAGSVSMSHFNAAPLIAAQSIRQGGGPGRTPFNTDVTGQARIDLALPNGKTPIRGTYELDAGRAHVAGYDAQNAVVKGRIDGRVIEVDGAANAYGARTSARGTIVIARPVVLHLSGRSAGVDLRNLPPVFHIPRAASNLQFSWTLNSSDGEYTGAAEFDESTLAGASIVRGTTGEVTFGRGVPVYAARGQASDVDVQQIGRAFSLDALGANRFKSRVNASFDVKGQGGGSNPLMLDATGTAVDSELFGGRIPRLDFTAQFADPDVRLNARGSFADFDPATLSGEKNAAGNLSGDLDVDTTFRNYASGVTVDSFDVSGRVNLTQSTLGGFAIESAEIEGKYMAREGEVTRLEVVGPDLSGNGRGAIALDESGASDFTAHVEASSLEEIGKVLGQPLKGSAVVDTTITGNARALELQGTLEGSQVGYGDQSALTLSSTFDITVPELTVENAEVSAKSTATFVEIGGRQIPELTADTTYSQSDLRFDAVAREGQRELALEGSAVLHPDHQEVHLGDVVLRTEQIEWRTVSGSAAAVRVANHRIEVEGVQLASGEQRIEADGVIGSTSEPLHVRAQQVDVSQLDRLLLGDERLGGRLDADATVSGPLDALRAEGQFTLTQGAFRQFMFESLSGKVDYEGQGVNLDVRLQQSPEAWLNATGYAPISLFRPNPGQAEGHETPTGPEAIDVQISSSQIDLGVVQGLTPYVTNVTGTMQANVKVTGTGHDPHFEGVVDIRGGAFTVPDLGTTYTGLDTKVELTTDAVAISEMRIVDEHAHVMTIGGMLAVHEREVGAVDVEVRSEGFEVVHNNLADLRLDTELRVTGELRAPRIEGFVEVDSGNVDVARVLEEATANQYSGGEVDLNSTVQAPAGPAPTVPQSMLFDPVELDIGIAVPGNLTLRGNDLRAGSAAIDAGDLNVTVGGALQVRKAARERVRLIGEVNTIRGSYTFQSRRFEIMRDGRIRFGGTEEIDPLLDVQARRIISGVETFVRLQGSMRQPELSFSSRPPQDQADILSLIVFGVPVNELGEGQQASLAERAGALAGGYLVSGLTQSLANALDLDELEFQAEAGLGPSLSIGEQIGDRLFVRIRQGFGAAEATELILEYQIADYLRLQGSVAETSNVAQRAVFTRVERGGLDLIFFFSY
jgi:autotransporter translocation and assembly factor TamB